MSKYDEDLKKACEILNNTELDELVQVAVEAMDDAATDIGMEASQEWHAKITLESALIHIAEKVAKRPQLTIPKSIVDKLDDIFITFIREQHSSSVWTFLWRAEEIDYEIGEQLSALLSDENQVNVAIAYLTGKALGVDLVKVE